MTDSDSLWLQKSIIISDPLDMSLESGRSSNKSNKNTVNATELEAIAMRPAARLSDGLRQGRAASSARLSSIANAMGGFNPFEVDELKGKLAQLNREKLRWEDAARDLERSKTELQQARDDYRALEEYTQTIKTSADEASLRAERDAKARQEAESKLLEAMRNASKEQLALKSQIDEVKKANSHKLFEMKEALEAEHAMELTRITQENESVVRELEQKFSESDNSAKELSLKLASSETAMLKAKEALAQREKELVQQLSQLRMELSKARTDATDHAKQMQERVDTMHREHADAMERQKTVSEEQLFVLREEAKAAQDLLQQRLCAFEEKYEAAKEDLFHARSDIQSQQASMKQLRVSHETAVQHAAEMHAKELNHIRSDLTALESSLAEAQKNLSDSQGEHRAVFERLVAEQATTRDLTEKVSAHLGEISVLEERLRSAVSDIESRDVELDEIAEVMQRMNNERDNTVKGYSEDLIEARARCDKLEGDLIAARLSLSNERKAHLATDGTYRRTIAELREQVTQAASSNVSAHTEDLEAHQHLRALCDQLGQRVAALETENSSLQEEVARTRDTTKRQRGLVDVPTNVAASREPSGKRHRPEVVQRTFAVSGFDGQDLKFIKKAIMELPNADFVECRSNEPLPASVTHLVASGQLTVKLLSAAVKGCWVVPKAYVDGSVASGSWNDEAATGFKHQQLPLSGKGVFVTSSFKSSKHFPTAKLLIDQGGAMTSSLAEGADIILTTSSEVSKFSGAQTWETFVNEIYPVAA